MVTSPPPSSAPDASRLCDPSAYDRAWSVDQVFSAWAAAAPDAPAVRADGEALSYRALNDRADGIAAALAGASVGPGDHVALSLPRGADLIAAQLGVLRLGAAYAPLDLAAPAQRHAELCALLCAKAVLTPDHPALQAQAPPHWRAAGAPSGGDIAAIMFTSGSTGAPKGVRVRHRGMVRLVRDQWFARFGPDTVFLAAAPPAFDASHLEIWAPLLNGGCVAPLSQSPPALDDIAQAISAHNVTDLWLTAGLFHLLVDQRPDALTGARRVFVGGDVVSLRHIRSAQQRHPAIQFINGYGPTENTTFTTCYLFPPDCPALGAAPIGHALNATRLILDGDEGELHVAGDGVAAGYLGGDPEQRFRPDPDEPGELIYATGDLVRRRSDGGLDFLGRSDRQVKIAGRRIELAGLEQALRAAPGVIDAAVLVDSDPGGDKFLRAAITPATLDCAAVRAHLLQRLSPQEIPHRFHAVAALPLNATGKFDRATLLASLRAPVPAVAATADPRLVAIFQDILGPFDAAARFVDLGLTSLQMVRAHARIVAEIQAAPITIMFECADLAGLSQRLFAAAPPAAPDASTRAAAAARALAEARARRAKPAT